VTEITAGSAGCQFWPANASSGVIIEQATASVTRSRMHTIIQAPTVSEDATDSARCAAAGGGDAQANAATSRARRAARIEFSR
jgi:hypothetical protein